MKQEENSFDAVTRNTLLLSQSIEKVLRVSMFRNRRDEISAALKDIVGEHGILSARILNDRGIVKFSSQPSELNWQIPLSNKLCQNCHPGGSGTAVYAPNGFYSHYFDKAKDVLHSSLPVYNAPSCYKSNCHASESGIAQNLIPDVNVASGPYHDSTKTILGFIEINVSTKGVMADLERTRYQLVILTLIITLLASALAYFSIRRLVGKPVKNLVEGTRRVAQGDFTYEIPAGKGELKILAESFNHMQNQLQMTEAQLIESEKLASAGRIANQIANEINNPLTGIIIYSERLAEASGTGRDMSEDYETIRKQALRIRDSVRNILSLAKLETSRFEQTDVAAIIKHAISLVEKLAGFRNIHIISKLNSNLPIISADPGLIKQVMLNLFLISSENMSAGGVLNISAVFNRESNRIEVRIDDSGKGISKAALAVLSDEHLNTNLQNIDRTGISLAVCKDIIALHKGKLTAELKAGGGTSITFELPA